MASGSDEQPGEASAVETLREFFDQMNMWERDMRDYALRLQTGTVSEEEHRTTSEAFRGRLRDVFSRYCESGADAGRVKDALHCNMAEPDYNREKESITSVVPGRAGSLIIETQMTHNAKYKLRYEMIERSGRWLICDNRKRSADFDPKWKRWPL